jgi:hypothetical protein
VFSRQDNAASAVFLFECLVPFLHAPREEVSGAVCAEHSPP